MRFVRRHPRPCRMGDLHATLRLERRAITPHPVGAGYHKRAPTEVQRGNWDSGSCLTFNSLDRDGNSARWPHAADDSTGNVQLQIYVSSPDMSLQDAGVILIEITGSKSAMEYVRHEFQVTSWREVSITDRVRGAVGDGAHAVVADGRVPVDTPLLDVAHPGRLYTATAWRSTRPLHRRI